MLNYIIYVSQKSQPFNKIKYQRLSNKSQSPDPIFKTMVCLKKTHQECNRCYLSILQKRKHLSNAFFIFLKDEILKILIVRFVGMHKVTTAR